MASKLATRLAEKIERDCDIRCNPETFERTYAGKNQKAAGSFVWTMFPSDGQSWFIGSVERASELVKNKYYLSIDEDGYVWGELYE